jgi:transposase-like protein
MVVLFPADFTKQDAVKQAQVLGIGLNTLNKWLNKFVQSNDILHVAHGVYQKRIA